MDKNLQKSAIRKEFIFKRSALSKDKAEYDSRKINQNFITNFLLPLLPLNNSIISLYQPVNNEVNLNLIQSFFLKHQIPFALPRITSKDQPLEFILFKENQPLKPNKFYPKLLEPDFKDKYSQIVTPNIILTPLVIFDENLSRMGMGGGFYDRTINFLRARESLNNFNQSKVICVGLAYDFQKFEGFLPLEKTDQSLDFIVTNTKIWKK
jgi:5-formyltetrahydrofolate cyclo-ligase